MLVQTQDCLHKWQNNQDLTKRQLIEPSSKPVAGHAVPGPLCLTHPAPVEAAARLAADHVHAAPVPLW